VFDELRRIVTSVGDVAAPAAGNTDLSEEITVFFEEQDAGTRRGFREGDGGEKSGSATA
jgi:hypothetical protein